MQSPRLRCDVCNDSRLRRRLAPGVPWCARNQPCEPLERRTSQRNLRDFAAGAAPDGHSVGFRILCTTVGLVAHRFYPSFKMVSMTLVGVAPSTLLASVSAVIPTFCTAT